MVSKDLITSERINAIIGWILIGLMTLVAVERFLTDVLLRSVFPLLVVAVVSLPALTTRDWTALVPWPLLFVATIAIIARTMGLFSETAGYVAIAALALIIVVELDIFTTVELSRRFAIGFGVMTTLAIEALWIIAQFYSDLWLGTGFLSSQNELQKDIVLVTIVGFAMGGLFQWYFGRVGPTGVLGRSPNHGEGQ